MKMFNNNRGSVIMVSVILAGILLLASLTMSELISREIRGEMNVVQAGRAFYAAEAGVETALFDIKNHLPGYQTLADGNKVEWSDSKLSYKYIIKAQNKEIPCPWDDQSQLDGNSDTKWRVLNVQESISLPLYKYADKVAYTPDSGSNTEKIDRFKVLFFIDDYAPADPATNIKLLNNDILRWKISGLNRTDYTTETLNDYLPVIEHGNSHTTPDNPMAFCTTGTDCYAKAKFYQNVNSFYKMEIMQPISTFFIDHYRNYLILTNVGPNVENSDLITGSGKVKFRVVKEDTTNTDLVCEFVKVESDGISADYRQSLDAVMEIDSFMPVFDFTLYRTIED